MANYSYHKVKGSYKPSAHSSGDDVDFKDDAGNAIVIPDNAVISSACLHTITALTAASGTPTLALKAGNIGLGTAQNYNATQFNARATTFFQGKTNTTASGNLRFTAAGGAGDITAGHVNCYVEYMISENA